MENTTTHESNRHRYSGRKVSRKSGLEAGSEDARRNLIDLEELKSRRDLVDRIDWEMTPETAIEAFMEWGTGWSRRKTSLHYAGGEAIYFVVYDWENPPQVTLLRHDSQGSEEIAKVEAPPELVRQSVADAGRKPGVGVCAPNEDLKDWLRAALGA